MSVAAHKSSAPPSIRCAVLTVSDTRTETTDTSGAVIAHALTSAGHLVVSRRIVKDATSQVREALTQLLAQPGVQAIVVTGGTGITSRDGTYEVVDRLLQKRLDGFGELFRAISVEQIGTAAMMSRACAGLTFGRVVISLPGSDAAVRLGMERLVLPELGHLVQQATK